MEERSLVHHPPVTAAAPATTEPSIRRGLVIDDRYRVEEHIGSGAMGQVYRVVHETLQLPLAMKILHPELAIVPEVRERLEREARLSAWLDHPAVVQVTDFGEFGSRPYIVMRLVDGEELSARLERGPIPPPEVVEIGIALCGGLAHAHGLGLIHRDLKPENVVLTARGLRILDFGLARAIASDDPRLTRTGLVCGTPRYMSPEQASGDSIDVRSDVYAVGVLLHEMLRGEPLFDGPNAAAVLRRQIVDPPPVLKLAKDRRVDVRRLESVVAKALEKDPAHRYPDASALEADLETCRRPKKPSIALRVALAAVLIALMVAAGFGSYQLLTDPFLEANVALMAGQHDMAEASLKRYLRSHPTSTEARFLLGRVAFEKGQAGAAAREWENALDSGDPINSVDALSRGFVPVLDALGGGSKKDYLRAARLVEKVAVSGGSSSIPLLIAAIEEVEQPRLRRRAFEGLEQLGATDTVDAFTWLSEQLAEQQDERCTVRRWYTRRLAKLGESRADALVQQESKRPNSACIR